MRFGAFMQCLQGRRVIFLGDSLAVQQSDSMVVMLGWKAGFLKEGDPRCNKVPRDQWQNEE